jgi:hypothetical protein
MDDPKFEELLRERKRRLDDLEQGKRDGLPSADLIKLQMLSDEAWGVAEEYRVKTGCSPTPVP